MTETSSEVIFVQLFLRARRCKTPEACDMAVNEVRQET